jgi:predicted permease
VDAFRRIYTLSLRLRSLFYRSRVEDELEEELRYHEGRLVEAELARGSTFVEARFTARRAMDGLEQRKEECRDARRVGLFENLAADFRYGVRVLRRSPGFTTVAVLSLALGSGANTALFQLIDALRLRALPVARPAELVAVEIASRGWPPGDYGGRYPDLTYPQWEALQAVSGPFSALVAWAPASLDLAARGESRFSESSLWVSGGFFEGLGVRPIRGRLLTRDDDVRGCATPGVVLSHAFWQREYGGSDAALGSTLTVQGRPLVIVGVSQSGFFGLEVGRSFDLAVPLCAQALFGDARRLEARSLWWLAVVGRLGPGVSVDQAANSLANASSGLFEATLPPDYGAEDAARYRGFKLTARPLASGFSQLREQYQAPLFVLTALAGTVLLIACANLANLLLARMGAREREMALRLSLGASRARLARQLLVESFVLAALGTCLGALLAGLVSRAMIGMISTEIEPMFVALPIDFRLLAFTAGLTATTCVLFGLAPALRATRVPPGEAMKSGGRGFAGGKPKAALRRSLVVAQVALSFGLVVGGLLFGRSLFNLLTVETGFRAAGILEADVDMRRLGLSTDERRALQQQLLERLAQLPTAASAATARSVPLVGNWYRHVLFDEPGGRRRELASFNEVSAEYFRTLETPVLAGRAFDARDAVGSPLVAIVNQTFARRFVRRENPVGATFRLEKDRGEPGELVQVVGLAADTKYRDLREEFRPIAYLSESQAAEAGSFVQFLIRARGSISGLRSQVKSELEGAGSELAFHFHDFEAQGRASLRQDRLLATLCGAFALLGMGLAAIGVYGTTAYAVAQRRSEFGIRLALGADKRRIVRLVLGEGASLLGIAFLVGAAFTLPASRAASALLFGLAPHDPVALLAAALLLAAVTVVAGYLPARQAAQTDPIVALRCD